MSIRNCLLPVAVILVVATVEIGVNGSETWAQDVEIVLDVGEISAYPGEIVELPVYFSNYVDTIAGFNFWVQLDRPDIMEFNTVIGVFYDTTWWVCTEFSGGDCFDSMVVQPGGQWDFFHVDTLDILIGNLDSTGTLTSGWGYLDSRSLGGMGWDLNVVGIANLPSPPTTPGIAPQENGLLIKLVGQVYDIPDSMTDRTVNILVQTQSLDHFSFSDPQGNGIGIACDTIPDTNFFLCTNWAGDICLNWTQVSGPPYDSIEVVWDSVCYSDTSIVQVLDGSVTVLSPILYGDANCSGSLDIADLVYAVDYMFLGGPPSPCAQNIDCDYDNEITITDLICLVEWMFPPQ